MWIWTTLPQEAAVRLNSRSSQGSPFIFLLVVITTVFSMIPPSFAELNYSFEVGGMRAAITRQSASFPTSTTPICFEPDDEVLVIPGLEALDLLKRAGLFLQSGENNVWVAEQILSHSGTLAVFAQTSQMAMIFVPMPDNYEKLLSAPAEPIYGRLLAFDVRSAFEERQEMTCWCVFHRGVEPYPERSDCQCPGEMYQCNQCPCSGCPDPYDCLNCVVDRVIELEEMCPGFKGFVDSTPLHQLSPGDSL